MKGSHVDEGGDFIKMKGQQLNVEQFCYLKMFLQQEVGAERIIFSEWKGLEFFFS